MLDKNIGIFLISGSKLDDSFPLAEFEIGGFTAPYRYDRNNKEGGFYRILGRTFHHVYSNLNLNAI